MMEFAVSGSSDPDYFTTALRWEEAGMLTARTTVPVRPHKRSRPDGDGKGPKTVPVERHRRSKPKK